MKIKIKNNFLSNLALVIFPLLILFWLIASVLLLNRVSFSVLTYQTKNLVNSSNNEFNLSKNKTYKWEFKAKDNNLGILIISIDDYKRQKAGNEDILIFKFKEKGRIDWDYKMEYSSFLFDSQSHFPFGIPVISNSKNKIYQFELSSTRGDSNNPIKLKSPLVFITGYQYSKSEIMGRGLKTIEFASNKIFGLITDLELLIKSSIYLIPLILYSILFLFFKRFPINAKHIVVPFILFLFFKRFPINAKHIVVPFKRKYLKIYIFIILLIIISPKNLILNEFMIVLFSWTCFVYYFKLKSIVSFKVSLIIVIFWIAIIPFGFNSVQKIANELVYALFIFGCLQLLYEQVKSIKKIG